MGSGGGRCASEKGDPSLYIVMDAFFFNFFFFLSVFFFFNFSSLCCMFLCDWWGEDGASEIIAAVESPFVRFPQGIGPQSLRCL